MIYCELLHLSLKRIYAADHEVKEDSIENEWFQRCDAPEAFGYVFVKDYDTQETNTTAEQVRTDTTGVSAVWD